MMQFINACHFGRLHFQQSHKERECGFSALVLVDAVGMKSIPASARASIIQWNLQVVIAKKPGEYPTGLLQPLAFFRQPVYL